MVDPFQFYRKAANPMFSENQRYQNPGLVKNYDYDALVIGTSMSENFRKSYIDNKLGVDSLRTSISGGTIYEQMLTERLAVSSNKNLKKIIWIVDIFSLARGLNETRAKFPFPEFMYTKNVLQGFFRYLLSTHIFIESLRKLGKFHETLSLETLNNWNDKVKFSVDITLNKYRQQIFVFRPTPDVAENVERNINESLLSNIDRDIEYIVIFPPYSFIFYCEGDYKINHEMIDFWFKAKAQFSSAAKNFSNVTIYDFQDAYEIIYDLNNYKDPSHYSQAVNDWMIDRIADKDERYLVRNEETYQKRHQNFVQAINMTSGIGELASDDNLEEHLKFLRKNILENLSRDIAP